jgi:hypothetical protein
MSTLIRVDGIYDQRTIQNLQETAVKDFGFDFRPTSFNFLQQHVFLDLIKKNQATDLNFFLRYENEQDFVIKKMIDDLKLATDSSNGSAVKFSNFNLEFSDTNSAEFYDQFEVPFYWHYTASVSLSSILDTKNIKGIVLDYKFLEEIRDNDNFQNFVQNFFQVAYKKIEEKSLKIVLAVDWDANVFPSLFDFIDFDSLVLPINSKIEICYRNVDLGKVKQGLGHYGSLEL